MWPLQLSSWAIAVDKQERRSDRPEFGLLPRLGLVPMPAWIGWVVAKRPRNDYTTAGCCYVRRVSIRLEPYSAGLSNALSSIQPFAGKALGMTQALH